MARKWAGRGQSLCVGTLGAALQDGILPALFLQPLHSQEKPVVLLPRLNEVQDTPPQRGVVAAVALRAATAAVGWWRCRVPAGRPRPCQPLAALPPAPSPRLQLVADGAEEAVPIGLDAFDPQAYCRQLALQVVGRPAAHLLAALAPLLHADTRDHGKRRHACMRQAASERSSRQAVAPAYRRWCAAPPPPPPPAPPPCRCPAWPWSCRPWPVPSSWSPLADEVRTLAWGERFARISSRWARSAWPIAGGQCQDRGRSTGARNCRVPACLSWQRADDDGEQVENLPAAFRSRSPRVSGGHPTTAPAAGAARRQLERASSQAALQQELGPGRRGPGRGVRDPRWRARAP